MKRTVFILLAFFAATLSHAQEPVRIKTAFYNVENLFDTIRNPSIDDADYTPRGMYRWDTEKYLSKITNIARVIDDISADVIGLAEVENEAVLRDLMYALETDYNFIYLPTSDMRGIGQALLYRGSRFFPERTSQIRGPGLVRQPLAVEGTLEGMDFVFIVCHMPSKLSRTRTRNEASKSLAAFLEGSAERRPDRTVVLMGDINAQPYESIARRIAAGGSLYNPFEELSRKGYGTYSYRDKRYLYDQIMINGNTSSGSGFRHNLGSNPGRPELSVTAGIFVRDYMMPSEGILGGYPERSFRSGHYIAGYSDHLPVYLLIEKQ